VARLKCAYSVGCGMALQVRLYTSTYTFSLFLLFFVFCFLSLCFNAI
jgi:hypothetical protein